MTGRPSALQAFRKELERPEQLVPPSPAEGVFPPISDVISIFLSRDSSKAGHELIMRTAGWCLLDTFQDIERTLERCCVC